MSDIRIDGDGHLMELVGTNFVEYLDNPYRQYALDMAAQAGGDPRVYWWPLDGWNRNFGTRLFHGNGNRADEWLEQLERGPLTSAVLYPTFLLLSGLVQDPDFVVAMCRAYNDWASKEIAAHGDGRLHVVAALPPHEPAEAAKEVRRAKTELGLVAGMFAADGPHLLGRPAYDVVYQAAVEVDLAMAVHASGSHVSGVAFPKFIQSHCFNHPRGVLTQFTSMMFEGVFSRFPTMRVGFLEVGATWVPWYLDRMDEEFEKRGEIEAPTLTDKPSTFVGPGKNIFFGLEAEERLLGPTLDLIGADTAMYASDWPHWDGDYPHSLHEMVERGDLTEEQKEGVLRGAAQRFYGLP